MSNFWHDLLFPLYFFIVFIAAHVALYIMIFKGDKSKWIKNRKLLSANKRKDVSN